VLDPLTADRQTGARAGYPLGLAAQVAPVLGPLTKWAASGSAGAKLADAVGEVGKSYVVKNKGGNWVGGQVEDTLKQLKRAVRDDDYLARLARDEQRGIMMPGTHQEILRQNGEASALNNWVDKQLTRYVKNDMATPEDPIRAMAERGPIHTDPGLDLYSSRHREHRNSAGTGLEGLGQSRIAKDWENVTDGAIVPQTIDDLWPQFPELKAQNPWMETAPADTKINWASDGVRTRLGFDHLLDELRNATNPASGLPAHLQWDPKNMDRVSVPQAVQRVADINAWRAEQKAAADAARANNAATTLHKDYPDQGYKWVQLKKPQASATDTLPDGYKLDQNKNGFFVRGPDNKMAKSIWNTPEEAVSEMLDASNTSKLSDALKYEGDTMGHCVGGYCPDVTSGRSNIYSLRNSKTGEPHITVETRPSKVSREYLNSLPDPDNPGGPDSFGVANTMYDYVHRHRKGNGDFDNFALQALKQHGHDLPPEEVVQIKGKGNAAPADKYKPFAQDFVKSGKWARVGDLSNTGLVEAQGKYWTPQELSDAVGPVPTPPEYAEGGRVSPTDGIPYPGIGKRRHNDRQASADIPVQALRGWAAGTAGLPGDLEGLVRSLIPGVSNTSFWPTSDFYKEWLPGASETPQARAAQELGSFFGGAGSTKLAKPIASTGKAAARFAGEAIDAGMHGEGALARVLAPAAPAFAVKPKGGNWTVASGHAPEDALEFHDIAARNSSEANRWRDKQLLNYMKNQMGTVDDPLLKLEQEGRLHMTPQQMIESSREFGVAPHPLRGTEEFGLRTGLGTADKFHYETTGRSTRTPWENLSDQAIGTHTPGEEVNNLLDYHGVTDGPNTIGEGVEHLTNQGGISAQAAELLKRHSWLDKADPKTPIYGLGEPQGLGFQHMMDYLDQANGAGQALEHHGSLEAMRAAAQGAVQNAPIHDFIPLVERNLHLTDADVGRSSVSDIAAKTGEWNKVLGAQKQMADLNKGIAKVHRAYDNGHQWVEVAPEGLKAEGQAMKHCVGGYCNSVEGGGTKILSLRDSDGRPRATVELRKQSNLKPTNDDGILPDEYGDFHKAEKFSDFLQERGIAENEAFGRGETYMDHPERAFTGLENLQQPFEDWYKTKFLNPAAEAPDVWSIAQIKGPSNRAPSPDVLPHIQDLVKNGLGDGLSGWDDVNDLHNAGMHDMETVHRAGAEHIPGYTPEDYKIVGPKYESAADMINAYSQKQLGGGQYGTPEDWRAFVDSHKEAPEGFKRGGLVNGKRVRHFEDGGSDSGSSSSDSGSSSSDSGSSSSDSGSSSSDSGSSSSDSSDSSDNSEGGYQTWSPQTPAPTLTVPSVTTPNYGLGNGTGTGDPSMGGGTGLTATPGTGSDPGGSLTGGTGTGGGVSVGSSGVNMGGGTGLTPSAGWTANNPGTSLGTTGLGGGTTGISSSQSTHYSPDVTYGMLNELKNLGLGQQDAPGNAGQTINQALAAKTTGNFLEKAIPAIIQMVPGGGTMMTVGKVLAAVDGGMSLGDALKHAMVDVGGNLLSGSINKGVGQALGPDFAKALGMYNMGSSAANLFGAGLPTLNPGGMAVNALKNGLGASGFGSSSIPGVVDVGGSSIPDIQPWHGGSSGSGLGALSTSQIPQTTSGNNQPVVNQASYDPMALGSHSLRVYDPVFKQGKRAHE
jgi:hypothetical protein